MNNLFNMRRDSLISPWGVGSIANFPHDESLMVAGLDWWFPNNENEQFGSEYEIIDLRLSERLDNKRFYYPPDYKERSAENNKMKIPAVRFPLWNYCPVCGNMEINGAHGSRLRCTGDIRRDNKKETYCSKASKASKKTPYLIPERFVAVCECGHIEDFPILEWVHVKSKKEQTSDCKLYRSTGGLSSSLAGVRYTCTCGASATMQGAFGKGALDSIEYRCTGNMPWLGDYKMPCGKPLTVMQRGATNLWYADVVSSIYIPTETKKFTDNEKLVINKGVETFKSSTTDGDVNYSDVKSYVSQASFLFQFSNEVVDELTQQIVNIIKGIVNEDKTEDYYREQEFKVLSENFGKPKDELCVVKKNINEYSGLDYLSGISLVHKLRETRAFCGFKRIVFDSETSAPISKNDLNWLPAVKNQGEGILFVFDYNKVKVWASQDNVKKRVAIIENNLRRSGNPLGYQLNPAYVLLHTFSHCLINGLASESGYSNSSIRERIYCSKDSEGFNKYKMAAVLIYTASGDSEGSLGGLVRQGLPSRIENVIKHALNDARWCASDPVCIQSEGQGTNGCNLAACHNCALLPETSCENFNSLLDRGVLIGSFDDYSIGFFNA